MAGFRVKFTAIRPDVRGLTPNFEKKIVAALMSSAKSFEKDFKKVTNKFKHTNKPIWKVLPGSGGLPGGGRNFGSSGVWATWAIAVTSNDPIFFYLEAGARRFRAMSPDWQSMTRGGGGITTYARAGNPGRFPGVQVGYIEPRNFAEDVVNRNRAKFEASIRALFGQATVGFFGNSTRS